MSRTYDDTRLLCLRAANLYPEAEGTIENIVRAVARQPFPERALEAIAVVLAKFADGRKAEVSRGSDR